MRGCGLSGLPHLSFRKPMGLSILGPLGSGVARFSYEPWLWAPVLLDSAGASSMGPIWYMSKASGSIPRTTDMDCRKGNTWRDAVASLRRTWGGPSRAPFMGPLFWRGHLRVLFEFSKKISKRHALNLGQSETSSTHGFQNVCLP